jgi:bifunctional non-homologous end joining protein LigD
VPRALVSPARVTEVLDQLDGKGPVAELSIGRDIVPVSRLDKVLWPDAKRPVTKRDLLRYLARVSPWLLPHLDGRPVFVTRFPDGIQGKSFFQKVWEERPEFVKTVPIWSSDNEKARDYLRVANLQTLLWLGQMAALELHVWFSRTTAGHDARGIGSRFADSEHSLEASRLNYPDFLVFDLDSYDYSGKEAKGAEPELHRRGFARVRDIALELRTVAETLGLTAFVKTSGRTGLHVYLPIMRRFTFDEVRRMAESIGRYLAARRSDVTLEWSVDRRRGKVFFDYNQNVRGKSLAAIFSPRRHPQATVSMPLRWQQLERVYPTDFTLLTAPAHLERSGDPWAEILDAKEDLAHALGPGMTLARAG